MVLLYKILSIHCYHYYSQPQILVCDPDPSIQVPITGLLHLDVPQAPRTKKCSKLSSVVQDLFLSSCFLS